MSNIERTGNALRHGQIIIARGRTHRIEWGLDNRLYLVDTKTNEQVVSATGQTELRRKIERLEREWREVAA
jgi:hypothetical protein